MQIINYNAFLFVHPLPGIFLQIVFQKLVVEVSLYGIFTMSLQTVIFYLTITESVQANIDYRDDYNIAFDFQVKEKKL